MKIVRNLYDLFSLKNFEYYLHIFGDAGRFRIFRTGFLLFTAIIIELFPQKV